MPHVIIRFRLPDEQAELDAAMQGAKAKSLLWDIDQKCRATLKHGDPCEETARLAEEIRQMIAEEPGLVD